ncbi:MAG: EAL domain-containing protein, partial [Actinomycetota bacterium]
MSRNRRLGGLPLAVYVVALLLVPLTAVGLFGVREIARNNELSSTTEQLANVVELRASAATMRAPLEVERLAALGLARIHELGLAPAPVVAMTGVDFDAILAENDDRRRRAEARLMAALEGDDVMADGWLLEYQSARSDLDEVVERIGGADSPSLHDVREAFARVGTALDELVAVSAAESATLVPPSVSVATAVDAVVAVSDVANAAAREIENVGDAALLPSAPDASEMLVAELRHADALDAARTVDAGQVASLTALYESLPYFGPELYSEASGGVFDVATVVSMSNALLERIGYLQAVSEFAFDESAEALSIVEQRRETAASDNTNTLLVFFLVGVASVLFSAAVIRSFARPLTRLRVQAERIGRGELSAQSLEVAGPSDVRQVTGAVNEMASTLALVEDHMQALALSDLDTGPELGELPGKVGASMRNSMERITALTTRLRASEARLAEEARIDTLSGLPNRFAVLEHLGRLVDAIRGADGIVWVPSGDHRELSDQSDQRSVDRVPTVGVMFLDVDGFKSVNDMHGHAVGDVVLREIAQRLRGSVREIDFVARLGGDEFLIVVSGVSDPDLLAAFGERLISEIEQPYVIGDQLFAVSASVGVTLIESGDDAMAAIERADAAVYQAKRRGRRRVEMFDHELQASIEHQAELELALRQAIQHDELRVHLQPLADLRTGLAVGAEALVRWERPGVGLVPPADFIPIAERSGLIFDLERWVLAAACRRVAEWRLRGVGDGMRLAVNISGRHLIEGDLLAALDDALHATGADPHLLEIELTESHLLDDVQRAKTVLAGVRSRGVKVAIDDFGTGYSSMTYLQKLPVDIVKIDRSFVNSATSNEFDSTVIESVVTIGRALSMEIVAEGIETAEQLDYVTRAGC